MLLGRNLLPVFLSNYLWLICHGQVDAQIWHVQSYLTVLHFWTFEKIPWSKSNDINIEFRIFHDLLSVNNDQLKLIFITSEKGYGSPNKNGYTYTYLFNSWDDITNSFSLRKAILDLNNKFLSQQDMMIPYLLDQVYFSHKSNC